MTKGLRQQLNNMGVNVGIYLNNQKVYISLHWTDQFRYNTEEKSIIRNYVVSKLMEGEILL